MRRHIRQACDSCKRRKAKCDGEAPACSSCRVLGLDCEYNTPRAKRGPKPRASRIPSAPASDSSYSPNQRAGSGTQQGGQTTGSSAISSTSPNISHAGTSPWGPGALSSTPAGEWAGTPQVLQPTCSPEKVHDYLTTAAEFHNVDLEHAVRDFIDLYIGVAFPIFPVFSPKAIMQSIPLLLPPARHYFTSASHDTPSGEPEPHGSTLDRMRAFTLLTAFCAQMCCRTGDDNGRQADLTLADVFLASSRGMLICYEDADIAQPMPSSPLIRLAHASVLHCQGKNRASRFLVGQALRLTVDMRLFEEASLKGLDAQETQIRRNLFWCLYTSDKSLSLLNGLPLTLFGHLADPTQLELGSDGSPVRLLDGMTGLKYQAPFEELIRPGFDLSNRQWLIAGDIVQDLDMLSRLHHGTAAIPEGLASVASNVTRNYTDFCSLLDITPAWVSNPEGHTAEGDNEEATVFQRQAFWAQHANLIVTMHCLKLILMVKAYRLGFAALMGFAENEELFALRNTEVACELVNDSARIPLYALRANGEAMAEKFRSVGVILLEISHRVTNEAIATRAKALFTRLLDLIARLDSRTSDNLGGEAP